MIKRHFIVLLIMSVLSGFLFSAGCDRGGPEKRPKLVRTAIEQREKRATQLRTLDVRQLAEQLESQSEKGIEPFNSLTYTEIVVNRGGKAAKELGSSLQKADRTSLLGLLALRKISPAQYKALKPHFRVAVLVDALKKSKHFNTWGLPHRRWEDAAQALIEEGQLAVQALYPLLNDKRDAPVWGAEDYVEYKEYKFRVNDYASALVDTIETAHPPSMGTHVMGTPLMATSISKKVEERDVHIQLQIAKLGASIGIFAAPP